MPTAHELAISFLYCELDLVEDWREELVGEAWPDAGGRIPGVVGALAAVGLLSAEEVQSWTQRLTHPREDPRATPPTRMAAHDLLETLLDEVTADGDGSGAGVNRFEGALHALQAAGATDDMWDDRLRRRLGHPSAAAELGLMRELNAGGTHEELLAVLAGPADVTEGVHVVCVLRYGDAVTFLLRRDGDLDADPDDWLDAELVDDLEASHLPSGVGGGSELWLSFSSIPSPGAAWIELRRPGAAAIRVML